MQTHKDRILAAAKGDLPGVLPYVPRIDLWYNANSTFDSLPEKHKGRTQDEISRAEGWALHKVVPEFLKVRRPEDNLHRALGLYSLKEMVFEFEFSPSVEIEVHREGDYTRVTYHTPVGDVSTRTMYSDEMRKSGASITWIDEHVLKEPKDFRVVGYLFEHLQLKADFKRCLEWHAYVGEDGVACTMVGLASSPMHHIQKEFVDATDFYYKYNDYREEMQALAERVGLFFEEALKIIADSPATEVWIGDHVSADTVTPAAFEEFYAPYYNEFADLLHDRGKALGCRVRGNL